MVESGDSSHNKDVYNRILWYLVVWFLVLHTELPNLNNSAIVTLATPALCDTVVGSPVEMSLITGIVAKLPLLLPSCVASGGVNCSAVSDTKLYIVTCLYDIGVEEAIIDAACTITNCYDCRQSKCYTCIGGYYPSDDRWNCKPCKTACTQCTAWSTCTACHSGKWGSSCQNTCPTHCTKCYGSTSCAECEAGRQGLLCQDCAYGYYSGSGNCHQCPVGCIVCTSPRLCSQCQYRRWGIHCQNDCNLCKYGINYCSKSKCDHGCIDGYYGGTDSCTQCPAHCSKCDSPTSCTECEAGKWGSDCQNDCDLCKYGINYCSKSKCDHGCIDGYYGGTDSCTQCPAYCSKCDSPTSCIECEAGKWGSDCQNDCDLCKYGINYCSKSKCFHGCIDGYYGGTYSCTQCPTSCTKCDSSTSCTECEAGRQGALCQKCVDGYYAVSGNCRQCPVGCTLCSGRSICTQCNNEYFLDAGVCFRCTITNCQVCARTNGQTTCSTCSANYYRETAYTCTTCPPHCSPGSVCSSINGSCTEGCDVGWHGDTCNVACPQGCSVCNQDSAVCTHCVPGNYGVTCNTSCSSGCSRNSDIVTCAKADGRCDFGCEEGLWNYTCDNTCNDGCVDRLCNASSGHCLDGCAWGYFCDTCQSRCSENCLAVDNMTETNICSRVGGVCSGGCRAGFHGDTCREECSNCQNTTCHRRNGTCVHGCIAGYTGKMCSQAAPLVDGGADSDAATVGGAVGGSVFFIIVISIIVGTILVIRKRRSGTEERLNDIHHGKKAMKVEAGPMYYNAQGDDVVTNIRLGKAERQNKEAENTSFVMEADVLDSSGQSVVEGDTYYNTAALMRNRIPVDDLQNFVASKTQAEFETEFQKLPAGLTRPYSNSQKPDNQSKNRYKSIYPYDDTRVVLKDGGPDYINASYVQGYQSQSAYIAALGPTDKTIDDFWRMVWQEESEIIVMLTRLVEAEHVKCKQYWPNRGAADVYGSIRVTCHSEDEYAEYTVRSFSVTKAEETRRLHHVHFTAWPDKGVPEDVTGLIEFRQKVRNTQTRFDVPVIVHCSAGIGRTGTFIALDTLTRAGEGERSVDVFGCVEAMRGQRVNMVQTAEQYEYLHHAVVHSLTFDCRSISSEDMPQHYAELISARADGTAKLDSQFQRLQTTGEAMSKEERSSKMTNRGFTGQNRTDADVPGDKYRTRLIMNRKPGSSDYINAVRINGFKKSNMFISAQTPLPTTVLDFLTLAVQEKCPCIINMDAEDDAEVLGRYWAPENGEFKHGIFTVTCSDVTTTSYSIQRKLQITTQGKNSPEGHTVWQMQYTDWPADDVTPRDPQYLLKLMQDVDRRHSESGASGPVMVHCKGGAERSGLYCAVSVLVQKMEIDHEVSLVNTVRQVKSRRRGAIPNKAQYRFCHQAVVAYLEAFSAYSNFSLRNVL